MIDTNIFDKLVSDTYFPDIWNALQAQLISFVTTEIQEQEIGNITNERQKQLLQSIPRKLVPLDAQMALVADKHEHDRRIAATAAVLCDMFVTEDRTLQEWHQQNYPHHLCCDYQDFRVWFLANIATEI